MNTENNQHPPSLKIFFATEMWERYGFYVVQTLLALYLVMHFKWDDTRVYYLVGSFTALTYLSPLIGGWIADHFLGQKRSILCGAIILCCSYLAMGFISEDEALNLALAGIAVGTGLLKPNISSLLGNEYPIGSVNRERGFTIFYMGITSGIILGTTLPSYLQSVYGWHTSFLSASFGLIFAILIFIFGVRFYKIRDYNSYQFSLSKILAALGMILAVWIGAFYTLQYSQLAEILFSVIALFAIGYLITTLMGEAQLQARQTIVIGMLCLISVAFWTFYFQMFHSLTLLLSRVAKPSLFGIPFPPPYYVAVQSLGMIAFGLFLGRKKKPLSFNQRIKRVGNKFQNAMLLISLAYLLITLVCYFDHENILISPLYFIPAYLLISLAELLLSPVGLSAITMLSSPKNVSTMMGIFFVSLGLGGFLSGKLASLTAIPQAIVEHGSHIELKAAYSESFSALLMILLCTSLVCLVLNRLIHYLMSEGESAQA